MSLEPKFMRSDTGEKIHVRKAIQGDIPTIYNIELEQGQNPWKMNYFSAELTNDLAYFYIAEWIEKEDNEGTCGFIIFWEIDNEIELHNIAVKGKYQQKGIGGKLIQIMLNTARRNMVKRIFLDVRESNINAINFYKDFHFVQINRRKKYYHNPIEDALVFCLELY